MSLAFARGVRAHKGQRAAAERARLHARGRSDGARHPAHVHGGAAQQLVDAARALARKVAAGQLRPDQIDEAAFAAELSMAGLPDPDLLIRTAGERRLSNFLLWQLSYAELHVTDVLWPEFREAELRAALDDFGARQRTYGGLPRGVPAP